MAEKIVLYTPQHAAALAEGLRETGAYDVVLAATSKEVLAAVGEATGLVVGDLTCGELMPELAERPARLVWIQSTRTGTDILEKEGIPAGTQLLRAEGVWGQSVAGQALALLFALLQGLDACISARDHRTWDRDQLMPRLGSAAGKRVLMLGAGEIGQANAATLTAMGAQIQFVARGRRRGFDGAHIAAISDMDAFLPEANVVMMALPSSPDTRNLLSADRIDRLRSEAIVVNVGLDPCLEEAAFAIAQTERGSASADFDVFVDEPLPSGTRFWSCQRTTLTPDVAGIGDAAAIERLVRFVVSSAQKPSAGEMPDGLVQIGKISGRGTENIARATRVAERGAGWRTHVRTKDGAG